LTKLGFAGAEDGSRYSLRPRMLALSHTYTASNTLSSAAQPILERMSSALRESFSVATLDGEDIVYIARTSVSRVMSVDLHIGSRLPAYCTSMGRILLAHLSSDQLESYLSKVVLTPYTTRTVNSIEKLRQHLRNVRRSGYAVCDQEFASIGPLRKARATIAFASTARALSSLIFMVTAYRDHLTLPVVGISLIIHANGVV